MKINLGDSIKSLVPSIIVATNIFSFFQLCKDEIEISHAVEHMKPLLVVLFQNSYINCHKLHFLKETVKIAHAIKAPRLSPSWALIEAFWYSLYMQEIIEEQYFLMWFGDSQDETIGRLEVMFQVLAFIEWIQSANEEGAVEDAIQDYPIEEGDEESDIEALVPKRFSTNPKRSKKRITKFL